MRAFDAAASAVRSYGVVKANHGVPRWYVYQRVKVKGGELPKDSLVFFTQERAQSACDVLNARAVIDVWRFG